MASRDTHLPMFLRQGQQLINAGLIRGGRLLDRVMGRYAVSVPSDQVARLTTNAGLAKQYLPDVRELDHTPDQHSDPIGDQRHQPVQGIVHRYPDRVLLMPHHACAVYCRFCFRRDQVGPSAQALSADQLKVAMLYIQEHHNIREVILSGGDPLMIASRRLEHIIDQLNRIDHVDTIRIHSRLPVAAPTLLSASHRRVLLASVKPVYLVIHCNQAEEITDQAAKLIAQLNRLVLLGQSVLLKGVNDNRPALEKLFRAMIRHRIKPYYLHHLDQAPGTAHFRVPIERGQDLMRQLRGRISGICLPHYMLDIPGGYGKVPLDTGWIAGSGSGHKVRDINGHWHVYDV